MRKIFLTLILILMIAGDAFAVKPMDYLIVYENSFIQNGETEILISMIYCRDGKKYRIESESSSKDNIDGTYSKSLSVSIILLDAKVNWLLDLKNKICRELPVTKQNLDKNSNLSFQNLKNTLTKVSEEKILNYNCDVYISEKYPLKYWISKDYDLMLKTESGVEGNKIISEVIDLRFEKQDDSLFEIPQDYKIIKLKVTSQEELDKQPPVTLLYIEKLLFEDMNALTLRFPKIDKSRDLSKDEVKALKNSIISGSDLKEVTNKEISEVWKKDENLVFILEWPEKQICNFWYDMSTGFLYVNKLDVFHKELKEHEMDYKWLTKYAEVAYKFKPSKEFEKILK